MKKKFKVKYLSDSLIAVIRAETKAEAVEQFYKRYTNCDLLEIKEV